MNPLPIFVSGDRLDSPCNAEMLDSITTVSGAPNSFWSDLSVTPRSHYDVPSDSTGRQNRQVLVAEQTAHQWELV